VPDRPDSCHHGLRVRSADHAPAASLKVLRSSASRDIQGLQGSGLRSWPGASGELPCQPSLKGPVGTTAERVTSRKGRHVGLLRTAARHTAGYPNAALRLATSPWPKGLDVNVWLPFLVEYSVHVNVRATEVDLHARSDCSSSPFSRRNLLGACRSPSRRCFWKQLRIALAPPIITAAEAVSAASLASSLLEARIGLLHCDASVEADPDDIRSRQPAGDRCRHLKRAVSAGSAARRQQGASR
jgi:hypothetical protein